MQFYCNILSLKTVKSTSKGVLPRVLTKALAAYIFIESWTVLFYQAYSSAENKEESLPACTILLAYVQLHSVQKWSVGRVGEVTSVVQVINNRAHSTCA